MVLLEPNSQDRAVDRNLRQSTARALAAASSQIRTHSNEMLGLLQKKARLLLMRGTNINERLFSAVNQSMLKNPIDVGWFICDGRRYEGTDTPPVTKELWDKVQKRHEQRQTRKFTYESKTGCLFAPKGAGAVIENSNLKCQ